MYGSGSNALIIHGFQYQPVVGGISVLTPVAPLADAVDIPIDSSVHFTISNPDSLLQSSLVVTIGGETAYSDGKAQRGWRASVVVDHIIDVILTRLRPFEVSEEITIEATWEAVSGGGGGDGGGDGGDGGGGDGPPLDYEWTEQDSLGTAIAALSVPQDVRSISGVAMNQIYVAANNAGVFKYDGSAWAQVFGSRAGLVSATGSRVLTWANGESGWKIFGSTDQGITWVEGSRPELGTDLTGLWALDDDTIIATGSSEHSPSRAWLSLDGGATWSVLFDDSAENYLPAIWGTSLSDLYFGGYSGYIVKWDGSSATVVAPATEDGDTGPSWGMWGPSAGNIYWPTDQPSAPRGQVMHYVDGAEFTETGPWLPPGGDANRFQMLALYGRGLDRVFAGGVGTGTARGSHIYRLQTPNDAGSGTWTEETLPSGINDSQARIQFIWVNPGNGNVCAVGTKSDEGGNAVYTSYFRFPSGG